MLYWWSMIDEMKSLCLFTMISLVQSMNIYSICIYVTFIVCCCHCCIMYAFSKTIVHKQHSWLCCQFKWQYQTISHLTFVLKLVVLIELAFACLFSVNNICNDNDEWITRCQCFINVFINLYCLEFHVNHLQWHMHAIVNPILNEWLLC